MIVRRFTFNPRLRPDTPSGDWLPLVAAHRGPVEVHTGPVDGWQDVFVRLRVHNSELSPLDE